MRDDYAGWMEVELRAAPSIGRKIKSADLPLPYRICPAVRSRHRETGFSPSENGTEATCRRGGWKTKCQERKKEGKKKIREEQ